MNIPNQILFIDKPRGITSFDVIRLLRKKLGVHPRTRTARVKNLCAERNLPFGVGVKKIGHAGTLDPFATGLLIVGVGEGTKRLNEYMGLPKTYVMDVLLGKRTDTGDPEGIVLEEKEVKGIDELLLKKILKEMEGEIELPIPKYSAAKHKGKPLYIYARKNILVEEKFRTTRIFYLKLLGIKKEKGRVILKVEMKAEKGTYARSVAEELGRRLGMPAMLEELRRTKIGAFDVSRAQKLGNDIIKP